MLRAKDFGRERVWRGRIEGEARRAFDVESVVRPTTESARPPVLRTIGGVPYASEYIWLRPHGSNRDGMTNASAPASIRCATGSS